MKRLLAVVLVGASLGACGGLLKSNAPPELVYTPSVPAVSPVTPAIDAVLTIARPSAFPGLDGDGLLLGMPGLRLDRVQGARWSASLPELVQAHLVAALAASGGWRAVASDQSAFGTDFLLQTQIRHFSADYATKEAPPVARVVLHGELGRAHERALLASFDAVAEVPAGADRQAAIVAAMQAALTTAAETLGRDAHAAALKAAAAPKAR